MEKFSGDYYPDSLRNYQQDPKMSYVINALLAIAHGLAKIHQNVILLHKKIYFVLRIIKKGLWRNAGFV